MEAPLSQSELAQRLAWAMNTTLDLTEDGGFRFSNPRHDFTFVSTNGQLQEKIDLLSRYSVHEETALVTETSYEILVQEESPLNFRRFRGDQLCVTEQDEGLEYELSPASDEYIVWLLSTVEDARATRDLGFGFISPMRADRLRSEAETSDAFQALRLLSSNRFLSLKIRSRSKTSAKRFQVLGASFLFHIAFNLDIAFVPVRFFEEMTSRGRISRMRRSRLEDLDPPRRTYNEDLVAHYILAVSTDSPSVQFLSYYHVLEHFFESIFNDDLIEKIRSQITHPAFSYKRKKDVSGLIDNVKKSLQIRSETITFSESEALRLTLHKHIDVAELRTRINEYSSGLLEYYRATEVPFSKAPAVDLSSGDRDAIIKSLAKRVYATRNALVHSKDGDKHRYVPFKDERSLLPEIPLMRFISEQVILKHSDSP